MIVIRRKSKAFILVVLFIMTSCYVALRLQFESLRLRVKRDERLDQRELITVDSTSKLAKTLISTNTVNSTLVSIKHGDIPKVLVSTLNDPYGEVKARFAGRRAKVDDVCARYNPGFKQVQFNNTRIGKVMKRTIVSLNKHAVMCYTLKSGSSSWNDVFWHLREPEVADKIPFFERAVFGNLRYYENLTDQERIDLYTHPDALRMMSVRHPFARLISGWEDKFTKLYYHNRWFDEFPLMKNYPNLQGSWNRRGPFMEWESFMQYVADHGMNSSNLDDHFNPTSCDPCSFSFDVIVKAETFEKSADWILKEKLNYATMRKLNRAASHSKPEEKIRIMFTKLGRETVEKLMRIYEKEMELFGYTFDVVTMTAGGWED